MKNLHLLLLTTICLTSPVGLHAHGDKKQDAHQLSAQGQDDLRKQKITLGQAPYSFELIIVLKGYSPCNVRFHKDMIVVPCLNARVAFVKRNGKIVSTLKMPKDYIEAGLDGIHDADISPDGETLVIGVWQRKGRPSGTLTRWKRIR